MITRRRFLEGSLGTAAVLGGCAAEGQNAGIPLPIPELVDARTQNGAIELAAAEGRHAFLPGRLAKTYGFSAPYLGPTLRVHKGDEVEFTVENRLDRRMTSHWHGVLVPAALDGGPHLLVKPGEIWRPVLTIDQPETTAWYHSHPHGDTGRQVYMGLAGLMIVEDGAGERLGLPRTYGVDDLPIILQDRLLDADGSLVYSTVGPTRMVGMRGDTLLVNGAISPFARVPRGLVRLRLLNAANARNFDLRFTDGRTFHVIASDGGYLPAPIAMTTLIIAPSERFEVLVDFSDGKVGVLETAPDDTMMRGMGGGMMAGLAQSVGGELLRLEPHSRSAAAASVIPATLVPPAASDPSRAVRRRRVSLDMGPAMMGRQDPGGGMRMGGGMGPPMGINGQAYDMDRIDFAPKLGDTEIWEVTPNMMAHPFHVHGVVFNVLSIGGKAPAPHLAGGKDTILLNEPAELLMTFTQPASREFPFMFHCHILEHEDGGMMGQYTTV